MLGDKINTDVSGIKYSDKFKTDENNYRWVMLVESNRVIKRLHERISDNEIFIKEMQKCIDMANIFFEEVMPQIGGICLQDYANMNDLGMALSKLKTKE